MLFKLFSTKSLDDLKKFAVDECKFTDNDWQALLVYAAGFIHNNGNYKGFGDTKFVPEIEPEKLKTLVLKSCSGEKCESHVEDVWKMVEKSLFGLSEKERNLGLPEKGTTCYHSWNMTESDTQLIDRFMKSRAMEAWNTRLFKIQHHGKTKYEIRLASVQTGEVSAPIEFEDTLVSVTRGDYSEILKRVNVELEKAKECAANDHEAGMLKEYINHFLTGDLDAHKNGSRHWIKNVAPAVETYIGFIENYRDPVGSRSEFEGFVACVDRDTSKKFSRLVENAEELISRLPWGKDYEKDKFLRPDFTSLDVLAFGTSGPPAGINIPNYDDIRQNEGFKNVSLGNIIAAIPQRKINFLSEEDQILFKKFYKSSFEVQVGLHELLGHGSGKLFQQHSDGKFNFDQETVKHLETNEKITSWYKPGETWSSQFGRLASSYEECRAEAVGYTLCCFEDVLKIFEFEGEEAQNVKYVNWMSEVRAGLVSLEMYNPEQTAWGQAHSHARFVLLRVCLEAGEGFVHIEETKNADDGKPDLLFTLDRSKIDSVGYKAVNAFLKKLQLYKSTADFVGGKELFDKYGSVDDYWLRIRDVVVARRQPRRLNVQPNTQIDANGNVSLVNYADTPEGMVKSFVERFGDEPAELWKEMLLIAKRDSKHWQLNQ